MDVQERAREFEELRRQHGDFLKAVLWRLTGDRERFADALQDCLLALWRHLDKLHRPHARAYSEDQLPPDPAPAGT